MSQSQPSPSWQAPTDIEQKLYEAIARGDWAGYFDVLADADLFISIPRHETDGHSAGPSPSYWSPSVGRRWEVILMEGVLRAPAPDPVFGLLSLGVFTEWGVAMSCWQSTQERYARPTFPNLGLWKAHADRGKGSDVQRGTLTNPAGRWPAPRARRPRAWVRGMDGCRQWSPVERHALPRQRPLPGTPTPKRVVEGD